MAHYSSAKLFLVCTWVSANTRHSIVCRKLRCLSCVEVNPGILFPCTCVVPVRAPVPSLCGGLLTCKSERRTTLRRRLASRVEFFPRRTTQIILGVMWRHANCNGQIDVCVSGRPQLQQRLLKLGVKSGRWSAYP